MICGEEESSPVVPSDDEFKEHAGFGLVFGDVGEVVQDQQVVFVKLGNGGFEKELATGDLEPLDEIGGAGEQDAPAVFDKGETKRCREMALAPARWPKQQQIGAVVQPGVTRGQCHDLGLADPRDGLKVEGVER